MTTISSAEQARIASLHAMRILDMPAADVLDRLTAFSAQICHTPYAAITVIDEKYQWSKASFGIDVDGIDRAISFCTQTVNGKTPFIVHDTYSDPLFHRNPLVSNAPHIRFYAGIPLMTADGNALGALAVMDTVPRQLDTSQILTLSLLAEQVMMHIEQRRQHKELEQLAAERDQINQALQRQALHLQEAQRIAGIGSWELDTQTNRIALSEEACRIFEVAYQAAPEDMAAFLHRIHADDRQYVSNLLKGAIQFGNALDIEYRTVNRAGETQFIRGRVHGGLNHGQHQLIYGTVQDVTVHRRTEQHLHLLDASVARLNDIVMITEAAPHEEPGPRIVFVNHAFETITGYSLQEVLGKSPRLLQGPKTQRAELDRIRAAIHKREPVLAEIINYKKNGNQFWLECHITPVSQGNGIVTHFVAIQRDITQRKLAEAQIEQLAFYDPLTQLPNRRLLLDRLHQAVALVRRGHHMGALFFIDMDNFKNLNDTLGHDSGDLLLKQVAQRLEGCVRSNNTVARLGGDEFVVMLEDLSKRPLAAATQAKRVGEKILGIFHQPFQLGSHAYHCSASIGVTLFNSTVRNEDELLQRADIAMYQAKTTGRNTVRFFDPDMQAVVSARVELERQLRLGLKNSEFVLHYQTQTNENGDVAGVEALVRWHHPQRGLLYPHAFISLAEETGLILPLGQWILENACLQIALWSKHLAHPPPCVAINISPRQFQQPDFVDQVIAVLHRSGADPAHLKLELTESMLIEDIEGTIGKMHSLRKLGVSFSLDDFGTGYSSLSYLKRLPLDQLKIDKAFVRDVLTDPNDAAIVRTIVALGDTLGLQVIAEGVETLDQRDFLAQHGCHAFQGYFFSQPLPAEQLYAH